MYIFRIIGSAFTKQDFFPPNYLTLQKPFSCQETDQQITSKHIL